MAQLAYYFMIFCILLSTINIVESQLSAINDSNCISNASTVFCHMYHSTSYLFQEYISRTSLISYDPTTITQYFCGTSNNIYYYRQWWSNDTSIDNLGKSYTICQIYDASTKYSNDACIGFEMFGPLGVSRLGEVSLYNFDRWSTLKQIISVPIDKSTYTFTNNSRSLMTKYSSTSQCIEIIAARRNFAEK